VPTSALRFGTNRAPTARSEFLGSWEVPCSFWTCLPAMNLPWRRSASCPNSQSSAKPRVWVGSASVPTSALRFGRNRAPACGVLKRGGSWKGDRRRAGQETARACRRPPCQSSIGSLVVARFVRMGAEKADRQVRLTQLWVNLRAAAGRQSATDGTDSVGLQPCRPPAAHRAALVLNLPLL